MEYFTETSTSLCSEKRIEGAFKVGEVWAIPDDAPKPLDFRMKSNKEEK